MNSEYVCSQRERKEKAYCAFYIVTSFYPSLRQPCSVMLTMAAAIGFLVCTLTHIKKLMLIQTKRREGEGGTEGRKEGERVEGRKKREREGE